MKHYAFYPFLLLLTTLAFAAAAAVTPRTAPERPQPVPLAGASCDSIPGTPLPVADGFVVWTVSVDGGGSSADVAANDSFSVAIDYFIQVCEAPTVNFCQVVAGYASAPSPELCIFRQRVDCDGTGGTLTFRMKAPAFPAQYVIALDLGKSLTEPSCPTAWPQGPPVPPRYLACITVLPANVPVAATGGADNVTPSSATLHATVNPAGAPTTARFLYGTAPGAYTDSVTAAESPVSGSDAVAVSAAVTGLSANTRYYFRSTVESENGYNIGGENSFYTGPIFSLAETVHSFGHLPPNGVKTDSVTVLNGGNTILQVTSAIPLGGQYSIAPATAVIGPGGSRKFAVTFAPPAYGAYNSGIVFLHTGLTSPDTQLVRGDVPIGSVSAGWNVVSVPLTVADPRKISVFPDAVSNAFEFSAGYVARDTVKYGRGYWLKFPATDSLVVTGDVRENESVAVTAGWNIIGGPSLPVPLDSISSVPAGIVSGSYFGYDAGYASAQVLRPGKGYWVKASQAGTLTLRGALPGAWPSPVIEASPPEGGGTLTIADAEGRSQRLFVAAATGGATAPAELPPPPPGGAFDARFEGDLGTAVVGPRSGARLLVGGARYPVTISWSGGPSGAVIVADGARLPLDAAGSLTLAREGIVEVSGGHGPGTAAAAPRGYGIAGNYPNPFNPSTTIRFDLPAEAEIRLAVFNALGEEVAVLASGRAPAGSHSVAFDASGLPAGVYFGRLVTPAGSSTARMLLVK